ncbi:hypothetical protein [[Eubacterium] cellulosolvens]
MRTTAVKRIFCLLVVLLFVVPSVTALNGVNQDNVSNDKGYFEVDVESEDSAIDIHDYIPTGKMSIEVRNALDKYPPEELDESFIKYLARLNEKMLARYDTYTREFPDLPYIPIDITSILCKYDPDTGMAVSAFPNAILSNDAVSYRFAHNPQSLLASVPVQPDLKPMGSNSASTNTGTRGSRAPPEADLSVSSIEWTAVNSGWGEYFEIDSTGDPPTPVPGDQYPYGGFQLGKNTRFTVTITNLNPTVTATNVKVNFSVSEYYSGTPMMRPESKEITVSGVTTQVNFDFVPPFAGSISMAATVDYAGDPEDSNDGYGWYRMPVFIWSADFESSGTNWGWQKLIDGTTISNTDAQWTGDRGTTDYKWHKTNTPANPAKNEHTASNAWYHGNEPNDDYEDTLPGRHENDRGNSKNNTYLETPRINMGPIIDGQEYLGELDDDHFYLPYTPMYGPMATGELEIYEFQQGGVTYWDPDLSDWVDTRETADSPGADNWHVNFLALYGRVWGEYQAVFQGQAGDWNPTFAGFVSGQELILQPGYPWGIQLGDGSGGSKYGGGVRNWSQNGGPRFRLDFIGDGGGAGDNDPVGAYFDDFVTWGIQEYVVQNRVGFTELTYPKTNGVPILYADSTSTFTAKVKNYGKSQQVSIKISIYELNEDGSLGNEVSSSPMQKSAGTLGKDQESAEQIFSWSPSQEGDYKLIAIAGDYDQDWTPSDNKYEFILHVSPAETADVDVLLVDDDDSRGGPGSLTPFSRFNGLYAINTEFKMLRALEANDMKYRVYTVGYNETGPDYEIMSDYECVIWMTGLDNEYLAHFWRDNYSPTKKVWDMTLKEEDLTQLELFLKDPNEVKKLWLISPGFLYDKYGASASITANDDFARVYLKIARLQANVTEWNQELTEITKQGTPNPLEGVADSVMDDVQYTTYDKPEAPFRFTDIGSWVDIETNDKITSRLFYQDESHYNYNALQYKDNTKKDFMSAFFAFNFYLLNDETERKDCVYRILTGFGMTGGVIVKPYNNLNKQEIMPGQEINFRLLVTNTGKREDTMTLSVTKDNKYSDWDSWFEINGVRKNSVKIAGLSDYNKVYLYVKAPTFEDSEDYSDPRNIAGTYVGFTIKAVSDNTGLDNSTKVFAQIGAVGNITLTCDDTEKTIDVTDSSKDTAEFQLKLLNETNGIDNVEVRLSFKGDGNKLANFAVKGTQKTTPEIVVDLEPNKENFDVKLLVKAEEHTLKGYHNVTVEARDEENTLLDWVDLTVKVNQFYKVMCTTDGDLEEGEVNFTIDPNNYTDIAEEIEGTQYIKTSFIINALNFGNGYDTIALDYEENVESEDTSDWLFMIVDPEDTEEEVSSVTVAYYDDTLFGQKYGEEEVQFDVYIPIDVDVGTYIVDFFIESSNIEELTPGVNEEENNRVSFMFDIIKPNLRFLPIQQDTAADNFEFWDYFENVRILRDYLQNDEFYIEKKHKNFEDLSIEFKVAIDNIGDSEIDLEPSNIWLNITHQDEFGDIIYDANLTPTYPTSAKIIAVGDNETFTFLWESFDITQEQNTIVDYTFEITVDPLGKIYEKEEDDNSNEVKLTVNHLKKPKGGSSSTPGFEALIVIAAISITMVALYDHRRRQK